MTEATQTQPESAGFCHGFTFSRGVRAIATERARQVADCGYTPEYDDRLTHDELVIHAAAKLKYAKYRPAKLRRQSYAAVGALLAAEIDRLDRAAELEGGADCG